MPAFFRSLTCLCLLGLIWPTLAPLIVSGAPQRIVSINLASDELLLELVDFQRIAAVSRIVQDRELSRLADQAASLQGTDGSLEHLIRLQPDLVLVSTFTRPRTLQILDRLGVPVVQVPPAESLAEARENVLLVARALDLEQLGYDLVEEMDRIIAAVTTRRDSSPPNRSALILGPGFAVYGNQTIWGDILAALGFVSHADALGIKDWGRIDLETLILNPPDILIRLNYHRSSPTLGSQAMEHRALNLLRDDIILVDFPLALTLTANHLTAQTIRELDEAIRAATTKQSSTYDPRR